MSALSDAEIERMEALMRAHYDHGADAFRDDLAEKDAVVLLRDASGVLRGFSTLLAMDLPAPEAAEGPKPQSDSLPTRAFFSGDTVVEAGHRGTASLPRTWSRYVFTRARQRPDLRTVWFLISSGYKTYRFLPTFFRRFAPCVDGSPAWMAPTLDALARARYGTAYDPASGVVTLSHPTPVLEGVADLTPHRLRDPHVAYFASRNPGHARGDELACLTLIHPSNLTPAGQRMVGPDLARPW
ncbi:MAG: hypothetical protein AAFQ43_07470 [Bacteroidota bacterium]